MTTTAEKYKNNYKDIKTGNLFIFIRYSSARKRNRGKPIIMRMRSCID